MHTGEADASKDMKDILRCVICGRDLHMPRDQPDTCGARCTKTLLERQRKRNALIDLADQLLGIKPQQKPEGAYVMSKTPEPLNLPEKLLDIKPQVLAAGELETDNDSLLLTWNDELGDFELTYEIKLELPESVVKRFGPHLYRKVRLIIEALPESEQDQEDAGD